MAQASGASDDLCLYYPCALISSCCSVTFTTRRRPLVLKFIGTDVLETFQFLHTMTTDADSEGRRLFHWQFL
jgi:hypothetical protein